MMLMFVPLVFSLLSLVISENKVILNHINNREFLMLRCNITNDGCCQNMKEVEFFKNGKGVCTIVNCKGGYTIPLTRDDTRYYRCSCVVRDMRNSYLHVSKSRPSDFGNWTCACFDKGGGRNCNSGVMVISKDIFEKDVKNSNQKSTTCNAYLQYLLFFVGIVLAVIIVLVVGIIFLRRSVSKQVRVTRPTRLTKLLFGKKENAGEREFNRNRSTSFLSHFGVNDGNSFRVNKAGLRRREVQSLLDMETTQNVVSDSLKKKDQDEVLSYLVKEFPVFVLNATHNVDNKPDWCGCGKCRNVKGKYHSVCCRDRGVEVGCFSQSQDFLSMCLSKEAIKRFYQRIEKDESSLKPHVAVALKELLKLPTSEDGNNDVKQTNRWFRKISYAKCKEILPVSEKELFTPIPSCCKLAIREVFQTDCKYDT